MTFTTIAPNAAQRTVAADVVMLAEDGFKESEIWYRLTMRVDRQPLLNEAITPRVGTSTLSPFVTIETRS